MYKRQALQELYPGIQFGIGPAIENGFYYDVDPGEAIIKEADLPAIEAKMAESVSYTHLDVYKRQVYSTPSTVAVTVTTDSIIVVTGLNVTVV